MTLTVPLYTREDNSIKWRDVKSEDGLSFEAKPRQRMARAPALATALIVGTQYNLMHWSIALLLRYLT